MKWKFKRARGNSERGKKDFNLNSNFFYYPFSSSTNTRRKGKFCVWRRSTKKINFLIWFYFFFSFFVFFLLVLQTHIYILILLKFSVLRGLHALLFVYRQTQIYASNFLLGYYLRKKWGLLNYVCWLKLVFGMKFEIFIAVVFVLTFYL